MRPPFTVDLASRIHDRIIEVTGGGSALRDPGRLAAALAAPFQTFEGKDLYPHLIQKAAALAFGIIQGHPFLDGNKRTAFVLLLTFLRLHRRRLVADEVEIENRLVAIANGSMTLEKFTEWLDRHVRV